MKQRMMEKKQMIKSETVYDAKDIGKANTSELEACSENSKNQPIIMRNVPDPDTVKDYDKYVKSKDNQILIISIALLIQTIILLILLIYNHAMQLRIYAYIVPIALEAILYFLSTDIFMKKRDNQKDVLNRVGACTAMNKFCDTHENITYIHAMVVDRTESREKWSVKINLSGNISNGDMEETSIIIPIKEIIYNNKIDVPELDVMTGIYRSPQNKPE